MQRGAVRCNMPLFILLSPSIHPFPGPLCPWNTPTHATHSQHRSPHVQQQRRPAGAKNASQRLHCLCARYAERAAGTRLPSHCFNARAATIEATAHESAGRATGMSAMPKSVWSCSRLKCRCVYTYAYVCIYVCDWNVGHADIRLQLHTLRSERENGCIDGATRSIEAHCNTLPHTQNTH